MSDNWKMDLGTALNQAAETQAAAASCESQFVNGLAVDAEELAMLFFTKLLDRGRSYLDCRFGAGTPQAQAAWGDLAIIISQCVVANWKKLFSGGFSGFASAVTQCVAAKLLGGIGGGGGGGIPGFVTTPTKRCGE